MTPMTDYYERVSGSGDKVRRLGVFRRTDSDSLIGDELFNVLRREWEFTGDLSLGLRHMSDELYEPITEEQARARISELAPELDPDEVLRRPAQSSKGSGS
jgi:hypothetical protein